MNLHDFLTGIGFFAKYPYTDFHEMNLDWAITEIARLRVEFDDFAHVNSLKYAGEWDITKSYSAFSVVDDHGFGYMALKPVPPGTQINDAEYWLMVVDYSQITSDFEARITALETTVGDASSGLVKDVDDLQTDMSNAQGDISALQGTVGDASSGLVKDVDDLQTDMSNAQGDISALQGTVGDASSGLVKDVDDLRTGLGNTQGDVTALENTVGDASSGLVKDVNDLKAEVALKPFYIFQGDSYAMPSSYWGFTTWAEKTAELLGLSVSDYKILDDDSGGFADPGAYGTFQQQLNAYPVTGHTVTHVVVCAGANDRNKVQADVENAIDAYIYRARQMYPKCQVYISMIGWCQTDTYAREMYNLSYKVFKERTIANGAVWLESPVYGLLLDDDFTDYLHPSAKGSIKIAQALANELLGHSSIVDDDTSFDVTAATGMSFDSTSNAFKIYQRGDQVTAILTTSSNRLNINTGNISFQYDNWLKVADVDGELFTGSYGIETSTSAYVRDNNGDVYSQGITARIMAGGLYLKAEATVPHTVMIILPSFSATGPTRKGQ